MNPRRKREVEDLYRQDDGRRLNARNENPPQLRRWLEAKIISCEIGASNSKENALAVAADHGPAVAIDAKAAGEWIKRHQGLGQCILESGDFKEGGSAVVGGVEVEQRV